MAHFMNRVTQITFLHASIVYYYLLSIIDQLHFLTLQYP